MADYELSATSLAIAADDAQNGNRQEQLETLYSRNYPSILEIVERDPRLADTDRDLILRAFAFDERRNPYDGPIDDAAFLDWAKDVLAPSIEFYGLYREHQGVVYKAIWTVVKTSLDLREHEDPHDTVQQIAADVWVWLFLNLESFKTGTAKPSTRLYARARWAARDWRQTRLRERERFTDVADIGIDVGPDDEVELFVVPVEKTDRTLGFSSVL